MIKIQNEEYDFSEDDHSIRGLVERGHLIEVRKDEFYWTKKHFVKKLMGMARLVPFDRRLHVYWLALKVQLFNK